MNIEKLEELTNEYKLWKKKYQNEPQNALHLIEAIQNLANSYTKNEKYLEASKLLKEIFTIIDLDSSDTSNISKTLFILFYVDYYFLCENLNSKDEIVKLNELKLKYEKTLDDYLDYRLSCGDDIKFYEAIDNNMLANLYNKHHDNEVNAVKRDIFLKSFCNNKIPIYSEVSLRKFTSSKDTGNIIQRTDVEKFEKLFLDYTDAKEKFEKDEFNDKQLIQLINELSDYYIENFYFSEAESLLSKCFDLFSLHRTDFYHEEFIIFFINYYFIFKDQRTEQLLDLERYGSADKEIIVYCNNKIENLISFKEKYENNEKEYLNYLSGMEGNYTAGAHKSCLKKRILTELYEKKYINNREDLDKSKNEIFLEYFCNNKIPSYSNEEFIEDMNSLY